MIAEQFGAELRYIQGEKNIVADTLSRLELEPSTVSEADPSVLEEPHARKLAEAFATQQTPSREDRNLPPTAFPISFRLIAQEQQKDSYLKKKALTHKAYQVKNFCNEQPYINREQSYIQAGQVCTPPEKEVRRSSRLRTAIQNSGR